MRRISLNEDWKLWQASGEGTDGRVFTVGTLPCQVEDVLIREGIVENPNLHGINRDRWIGNSDWCYEKHFSLEETDGSWNLVLEGLDTFADIWLNGRRIAQNESAYMPCRIEDVKGLREGANVLRLEFKSPRAILKQIRLPGEQEELVPAFCRARVFRSGFHEFSGPLPDLVRIGVYGDIYLEQVEKNGFSGLAMTADVDPTFRRGQIHVEAGYCHPCRDEEVWYCLRSPEGACVSEGKLPCAGSSGTWDLETEDPALWWPRTHGLQPLYELEVRLVSRGETLDVRKKRIGFRRLEKKGDMDFLINGHPLKLWGANLAQADTVSGCYHRDRMEELLRLAETAHFNCLRVWGESEILPEEFYEECDSRGIMLWQDFYLGFNMYSEEDKMLTLCRREAETLVDRLKSHSSILLWCGGNEVPLSRDYQYPGSYCYGEPIFREIYPEVCARLDPGRYYHPNSPYGGAYANDPAGGDTHGYTHLWYVPQAAYPVFLSENCRVSTPVMRTMKRMMEPQELWPEGYRGQNTKRVRRAWPQTWEKHNSNQGVIKLGPVEHYYDADDAESMIYNIGAAHCEYIKKDVERFRRGKTAREPEGERKTKGHILWKFNNCSNMISYGVVDYFNEPQMAYYALKRAYEPVQVSFDIGDRISVWLVNDTMERLRGSLEASLFSLSQNRRTAGLTRTFELMPDESRLITFLDEFGQFRRENVLLARVTDENGRPLAENVDYVDIERHLDFPQNTGLKVWQEEDALVLTTERFARCVELTGEEDGDEFGWLFEDNYFDLSPGTEKRVRILGRHDEGIVRAKPYYDENEVTVNWSRGK